MPRSSETTKAMMKRTSRTLAIDRKSTRLNSSHLVISYAVFCLKKKIEANCFAKLFNSHSGSFTYENTTSIDLQATSYLMKQVMNITIIERLTYVSVRHTKQR